MWNGYNCSCKQKNIPTRQDRKNCRCWFCRSRFEKKDEGSEIVLREENYNYEEIYDAADESGMPTRSSGVPSNDVFEDLVDINGFYSPERCINTLAMSVILGNETSLTKVITSSILSRMISKIYRDVEDAVQTGDLNKHDLSSPEKYESNVQPKTESTHGYPMAQANGSEEHEDRNFFKDVEPEARHSSESNSDNSLRVAKSKERVVRISTYTSDNNSEVPLAENTNPNEVSSVRSAKVDKNYSNSPARSSHKKSVTLGDDTGLKELFVSSMLSRMISKIFRNSEEERDLNEHDFSSPEKYESIVRPKNESGHSYQINMGQPNDSEEHKDRSVLIDVELEVRHSSESKFSNSDNSLGVVKSKERVVRISTYNSDNNSEGPLAENTNPNELSSIRSAKVDENYSNSPARSSHKKSVTLGDDTDLKDLFVSSMLSRMISKILRNSEDERDLNEQPENESIVRPKNESTHGYQINTAQPNDSEKHKDRNFVKDVKPEVQQSSERKFSNSNRSNTVMTSKEHSQKNSADHSDRNNGLSSTENTRRSRPSSGQSTQVGENSPKKSGHSLKTSVTLGNDNGLTEVFVSSILSRMISKLYRNSDGAVQPGDLNEHDLSLPETNVQPKKESTHEDRISKAPSNVEGENSEDEDSEPDLQPNKLSSLQSSLVLIKSKERQVKPSSDDNRSASSTENTSPSETSSAHSVRGAEDDDNTSKLSEMRKSKVSFLNSPDSKKHSTKKNTPHNNRLSTSVDDYSKDNNPENMFSVLSDASLGGKSHTSDVVTEPLEDSSATNTSIADDKIGSIFEGIVNDTIKVEPYIVLPKSDEASLRDFPKQSSISPDERKSSYDEQVKNEFKNKYYNMIEQRLRALSEEIELLVSSDETGFLDMLKRASESVGVTSLEGNVDKILTAINEMEEDIINSPQHNASPVSFTFNTPMEKTTEPSYSIDIAEQEEHTNTINYAEEENKSCCAQMKECAGNVAEKKEPLKVCQNHLPMSKCKCSRACRCATHQCPKPVKPISDNESRCPYHPFSWCGNTFKKCCHSAVTNDRPRCGKCRQPMSDGSQFSEGSNSTNAKLQTDLET